MVLYSFCGHGLLRFGVGKDIVRTKTMSQPIFVLAVGKEALLGGGLTSNDAMCTINQKIMLIAPKQTLF